jgi:hypothetical protein
MKTELIKFHDSEILAVEVSGQWWIAIKPIAEAIGLNAQSAQRGIKNDEILGEVCTDQYAPDAKNVLQPMFCVPIEYIQGWLFGIETGKVKPEIRPKLILFKKECYKVLFNHFYGKNQLINSSLEERYRLATYLKKLNKLINRLMKRHKEVEREILLIDNQNYSQLGLFSK